MQEENDELKTKVKHLLRVIEKFSIQDNHPTSTHIHSPMTTPRKKDKSPTSSVVLKEHCPEVKILVREKYRPTELSLIEEEPAMPRILHRGNFTSDLSSMR